MHTQLQVCQQPCSVQVKKLFAGNFDSADAFRKHAAHLAQVHSASWPLRVACQRHSNFAAYREHWQDNMYSLASMQAVMEQMSIRCRAWSGQLMMTTAKGC